MATSAQASESSARASVDLVVDTDSNTTGGVAQATMTGGMSSAQAIADLFSIRVIGDDNDAHFSPGRPDASGLSDFFFEVQGTTGAVPEPASWALMILGFGMAGGLLRARARLVAVS